MKWSRYKWCCKFDEYWQGVDAACNKLPINNNPYKKDSRSWICWRAGWFGV